MSEHNKIKVILSRIKPKYKESAYGVYLIKDGVLYFSSGRNLVRIKEHFPAIGVAPEKLIENTIRHDSEYLSKHLANDAEPCYNGKVNDVL